MCTKENSKLFEISVGILFGKKRFIVSKKDSSWGTLFLTLYYVSQPVKTNNVYPSYLYVMLQGLL